MVKQVKDIEWLFKGSLEKHSQFFNNMGLGYKGSKTEEYTEDKDKCHWEIVDKLHRNDVVEL